MTITAGKLSTTEIKADPKLAFSLLNIAKATEPFTVNSEDPKTMQNPLRLLGAALLHFRQVRRRL